jgi:hypothetical protein
MYLCVLILALKKAIWLSKINKLHPVTWCQDWLIAMYVHMISVVQYFVGCGQSGWQETKETLMSITQAC